MNRIVRWAASFFASAIVLLLACIPGGGAARAQAVSDDSATATAAVSEPVSSKLSLARPIRLDPQNEYAGIVYSVKFSPGGETLATGWGDGTIRIWDVASRRNTATLVVPEVASDPQAMAWIRSVAFSPDGKALASGNDGSRTSPMIRLSDVASGQSIDAFNGQLNGRFLSGIYCVVYTPDGKRLASGHEDNVIRIWDVANGEIVRELRADEKDRGYAVAFSPDGKTLASGGPAGTITLWDAATGEKKSAFKAVDSGNSVYSLAFSPDGKTLGAACWMEGGGMLWDVATGKNTAKLKPDRAYSEVMNNTNDMTFSVAFSPDGRTFAQGCHNGLIALWDVSSRTMKAVLYGHTACVRSLDFSPDGNFLVSAGDDSTVRLWDLKEQEP